jgi:hypothetical protein
MLLTSSYFRSLKLYIVMQSIFHTMYQFSVWWAIFSKLLRFNFSFNWNGCYKTATNYDQFLLNSEQSMTQNTQLWRWKNWKSNQIMYFLHALYAKNTDVNVIYVFTTCKWCMWCMIVWSIISYLTMLLLLGNPLWYERHMFINQKWISYSSKIICNIYRYSYTIYM